MGVELQKEIESFHLPRCQFVPFCPASDKGAGRPAESPNQDQRPPGACGVRGPGDRQQEVGREAYGKWRGVEGRAL